MDKINDRFALYHMKNNAYLGDSLCVIYRPNNKEYKEDHLFANHILVLIKSKFHLERLKTVKDIKDAKIFINIKPVLLRISSECLLGFFGDTHCDCEHQRVNSLREIKNHGEGMFILLPQDAQGNGLFYKAKELELQINGFLPSGKFVGQKNMAEAAKILLGDLNLLDKRKYTSVKTIIKELGFDKYIFSFMSNNPQKKVYLKKELGIKIASLHKIKSLMTIDNVGEYISKLYSKKFTLTENELNDIFNIINSSKEIPGRVASVLRFIREDLELGKNFNTNNLLLEKIVKLLDVKIKNQSIHDLNLFQDSEAYEEYHTELKIDDELLRKLFKLKILISDESLHYEENYFYDLPYFLHIPSRTLKIRKIFRLNDLKRPISSELIYKISIENKKHLIKCIKIHQEDVINLIDMTLRDHNVHFLPVFTHTIISKRKDLKILIKRYSQNLRVLSLMGEKNKVTSLISEIKKVSKVEEIDNLTDKKYADNITPIDFNWDKLFSEEIIIFKKYFRR